MLFLIVFECGKPEKPWQRWIPVSVLLSLAYINVALQISEAAGYS